MGEEMTSPPSKMVPLRLLNPDLHVSGMPSRNRQLTAVSSSSTGTSRFRPPKGWTVKLVLRADGSRVDKYYYEPYTKQVFRSMREIQRYLNGEEYIPRHKSPKLSYNPRSTTGNFGSEKMIMSEGRLLRLEEKEFEQCQLPVVSPTTTTAISPFILPEGWVVEKVPRKGQGSDKYYYEPGTGRKFRSLVAVERHLQAEIRENAPLSHMFMMGNCGKDYVPRKRKKMGASASDFIEPPDKINWVLKDSGGLAWNPVIGRTFVPEPIKNQWAFRFLQLMSGKNGVAPDLKRWKRCTSDHEHVAL